MCGPELICFYFSSPVFVMNFGRATSRSDIKAKFVWCIFRNANIRKARIVSTHIPCGALTFFILQLTNCPVISGRHLQLRGHKNSLIYLLYRGPVRPQKGSGRYGEEEKYFSLAGNRTPIPRCSTPLPKLKTKLHGLSPRANYTDQATADSRRSDCQLSRIEGATWSAWRIPTALFSVF
jgi:hypothetical protein